MLIYLFVCLSVYHSFCKGVCFSCSFLPTSQSFTPPTVATPIWLPANHVPALPVIQEVAAYQILPGDKRLSLYPSIKQSSLHTLQQKRILTDLLWTSGTHSHTFKSCRGLPHPPLWSICHLSITYSCLSSSTHSFWSTDQHFTRTHKHPSHVQTQSLRVPTHTSVTDTPSVHTQSYSHDSLCLFVNAGHKVQKAVKCLWTSFAEHVIYFTGHWKWMWGHGSERASWNSSGLGRGWWWWGRRKGNGPSHESRYCERTVWRKILWTVQMMTLVHFCALNCSVMEID